jgi:hypothetical protein
MKKLLRLSLILLIVLGLLLAGSLVGFSWWVMRKMGPEIWVTQMEANTNCRMHIEEAKLSLFSKPAQLSFKGVLIAPRDAEVGKPLAERAPLSAKSVPILIPEIVLEVKLEDLLNRRLFVEKLRILSPAVTETQDAQGKSSLEALFKKPKPEESKTSASSALPLNEASTPPSQNSAHSPSEPASESNARFSFAVSNAEIEDGSLTILSSGSTVQIRDLDFTLTGIDIDPRDLANHNRMTAKISSQIQVTGQARIGGVKRPAELANLNLSGEGSIVPIDPNTGDWMPTSVLKLTLAQGSTLAGHITMGDAAGKEMKKLMEYGIDLTPVRVGGPLQQAAVVEGIYRNNRFWLRADTLFSFPEYEISIEKKSWIDNSQDSHEMEFRLSCGPELQDRLQKGMSQAQLGEKITKGLMKALADERGRLTFDIESGGSLSDPKIKPKLDRILKNLIRGEGLNDLLQGLFKKL